VTELPQLGLYRRVTAAALLLAPVIFLLDNLIHPKEYARDNEAKQLAEIAEHYDRWQIAHALGFIAIIVFAAAVLGLAFLVRRRNPMLGLLAGGLAVIGLLGLAAVITIDGYTWGVLGHVSGRADRHPDQDTLQFALHGIQQSKWSLLYYVTPLAWIVGVALLGISAARQGAVPAWAGGVFAIGAVMVGIETAVTSNAYFIAAAAVLSVGSVAIGVAVARMSDEQFARGGPR
jgi:hypothetical protein